MSGKAGRETLASLVFVGWEIRQNTAATRSATVRAITNESLQALTALASDSALADLRLRGQADASTLTELQAFQFFAYYRSYWLHMQNVFIQRRLGVLEAGVWDTYAEIICTDYPIAGVRATWSDHAPVLDSTFVAFVESCPVN